MQNIGNIIKIERLKQHITQKVLAQDICSTSYLSKIESGKQIPQDEVKNALLNRLQVNLEHYLNVDEEQFMKESYQIIQNALMTSDPLQIKKTLNYYRSMNLEFSSVENFYTFNLRLLRMFLLAKEPLEKIDPLLKAFSAVEENLTDRQKFFYYGNCFLYYYRFHQYQIGLSFLEKASLFVSKIQLSKIEKAEYYYMLSSAHHKLYRTLSAIEYAQQALELFTELEYPQQIVNCSIRLGLSHIQNGHYHCSLEIFHDCYHICEKYNLKNNYSIIFQNLGYSYALEGNSKEAISYYRKSLAIKKDPVRNLMNIYSIVKEYSKLKNAKNVEIWCRKGLELIEKHHIEEEVKEYIYHFQIYQITHQQNHFDERLLISAINFFDQNQDYPNVYKYTILLGSLLCEREEYQKATHYYQKANKAMYAMKKITTWEDL